MKYIYKWITIRTAREIYSMSLSKWTEGKDMCMIDGVEIKQEEGGERVGNKWQIRKQYKKPKGNTGKKNKKYSYLTIISV